MPLPKDPDKLAEYREKMRQIAFSRGFGKWMRGRVRSPEAIAKASASLKTTYNTLEMRQQCSERAKACGSGKWMKGRTSPNKDKPSPRKGITNEQFYGVEKAKQIAQKCSKSNQGVIHKITQKGRTNMGNAVRRSGLSYTQIYGQGRAAAEAKKRSEAHQQRWYGKVRKYDLRPYHNGEAQYERWRKAVFTRDSYTCQRCGKRNDKLNAHHIFPWALFPLLRYNLDNGITLCSIPCHKIAHQVFKFELFNQQTAGK